MCCARAIAKAELFPLEGGYNLDALTASVSVHVRIF